MADHSETPGRMYARIVDGNQVLNVTFNADGTSS